MAGNLGALSHRCREALDRMLDEDEQLVSGYTVSYGLRRFVDSLGQYAQRVDDLDTWLGERTTNALRGRQRDYEDLTAMLGTLSPLSVLSRGYSVCQRLPDGRVVRDSREIEAGQRMRVRFATGQALCRVEERADGQAG